MAKVLVVGDIYSENQFFVPTIPVENEFSIATEVTSSTGSKTINTSRILSRLKNQVDFYAKAGTDDLFLKVLSDLKKFGINIDLIAQADGYKTGQFAVTTDEYGRSSVSIFFGANSTITPDEIASLEKDLNKYQIVYAATHLPLECLYKLIDICDSKKVPLFLDFPNQQKTVDLNKLKNVDFVSPNREEAEMIFDSSIKNVDDAFRFLNYLRNFCKGTIILTLDIDGCAVLEKGQKDPVYYQTTPVQAVDSTGAGDIFKGVFVSEIIKTKNLQKAILHAQQIATRSVMLKGEDYTLDNLDLSF